MSAPLSHSSYAIGTSDLRALPKATLNPAGSIQVFAGAQVFWKHAINLQTNEQQKGR
jgi:hypothetical protein